MTFMPNVSWRGDERAVIETWGLNVVASMGGGSEKPWWEEMTGRIEYECECCIVP